MEYLLCSQDAYPEFIHDRQRHWKSVWTSVGVDFLGTSSPALQRFPTHFWPINLLSTNAVREMDSVAVKTSFSQSRKTSILVRTYFRGFLFRLMVSINEMTHIIQTAWNLICFRNHLGKSRGIPEVFSHAFMVFQKTEENPAGRYQFSWNISRKGSRHTFQNLLTRENQVKGHSTYIFIGNISLPGRARLCGENSLTEEIPYFLSINPFPSSLVPTFSTMIYRWPLRLEGKPNRETLYLMEM